MRRKQSPDIERIAFGVGECGAFVQDRILQQPHALWAAALAGSALSGYRPSATLRLLVLALALSGPTARLHSRNQIVSGTILIAPHGHSDTQMPQPLQ